MQETAAHPPTPTVPDRFRGTARLYGSADYQRLRDASVLVIGIGGVGSWTVEALARTGIGRLALMDLDDICQTNINRQLHATDHSIGRLKVEEMAARVATFAPHCHVEGLTRFLKEETVAETLDTPYDLVIDAIDSVRVKCALLAEALERQQPIVTVGAAGGRRQAWATECAPLDRATHDPLLRAVRKQLRRGAPHLSLAGAHAVFSKEAMTIPKSDHGDCGPQGLHCEYGYGSVAHVTGSFGLAAAGVGIELLLR